jgi:Lrp/AsnC family transcriptional regulator, regulator for asnA, asnC and gidA
MLFEDNKIVDEIDEKIISILIKNARENLNEIAKECSISSSSVLNRIEKLKKKDVIIGTRMNLKRGTLGYPFEASIGIIAEVPHIETVAQGIRKQSNVIVCTKSIGRYNMLCLVVAQSTEELDKVTQKIKNLQGVKGIAINLWIDQPYFRYQEKDSSSGLDNEKLDSTDLEIIKELIKDARTPFSKIAETLKISHETVRKKYLKLRKNGTILGCSTIINWSKLGYQGTLFIFISQGKVSDKSNTFEELKKIPELFLITKLMGKFDILANAITKNLKDTAKLVNEIQQIPSIEQIDVCFATFTYFSFAPMPRTPFQCDTLELS